MLYNIETRLPVCIFFYQFSAQLQEATRMATTRDLDLSMAEFVQFSLRFSCFHERDAWTPANDVVVQFSSDAGVHWNNFMLLRTTLQHSRPE